MGSSLSWKNPTYLRNMPEERHSSAAVIVKDKYLVVIGGFDKDLRVTAGCLIYDIWCNRWSSTPASMDMIEAHGYHTAAVLDGKIVVAGGGVEIARCLHQWSASMLMLFWNMSLCIIHCQRCSIIEFLRLANLKASVLIVQSDIN